MSTTGRRLGFRLPVSGSSQAWLGCGSNHTVSRCPHRSSQSITRAGFHPGQPLTPKGTMQEWQQCQQHISHQGEGTEGWGRPGVGSREEVLSGGAVPLRLLRPRL